MTSDPHHFDRDALPLRQPLQAGLRGGDSLAETEIAAWQRRSHRAGPSGLSAFSDLQRQMDRYPVLSPAAQLELIHTYQNGTAEIRRVEQAVGPGRTPTTRQARKLREYRRAVTRAEQHLVGANFRLLLVIARENAEKRYGREHANEIMADVVAEGSVALVEAIHTYDETRCPVFSTYAARVMRDRIRFVVSKEGAIRLAPSWNRIKRIASVQIPKLEHQLGRKPSDSELQAALLAHCLEWADDKLTDAQRELPAEERELLKMAKLRKQGMLSAIASIREVLEVSQSVQSLDRKLSTDSDMTVGDTLGEDGTDEMVDAINLEGLRAAIDAALAELPERERDIVRLRFGFEGGPERVTYAVIGERYGVTAERIRQIERNVLAKLSDRDGHGTLLASFLPSHNID